MWYESITKFHAPGLNESSPVYIGVGSDAGWLAFNSGGYKIAKDFIPSVRNYGDILLKPVYNIINGNIYWADTNSLHFLYKSAVLNEYIYINAEIQSNTTRLYPGMQPRAIKNTETNLWEGDAWYTINVFQQYFNPNPVTLIASPKGTLLNSTSHPVYMTLESQYYEMSEGYGELACGMYNAVGTAAGIKYIGTPWWQDNLGNTYEPEYTSVGQKLENVIRYRGSKQDIYYRYASNNWIMGEYGSVDGWYSGTAPNIDYDVVLKIQYPDDLEHPENPPGDITITFKSYRLGNNSRQILIAEPAICR